MQRVCLSLRLPGGPEGASGWRIGAKYTRGPGDVQGGKCGLRGGTGAAVPPRRPRLEARGAPRRDEDVGCGRRNAEGLRRGVVHGLERIGPLQNLRIVARKSDKDNETGAAREPLAGQAKRSASVTTAWTADAYLSCSTPSGETRTVWTDFLVPVSSRKTARRRRRSAESPFG